jgi:2-phospho-L-lactate guanylyltransferase
MTTWAIIPVKPFQEGKSRLKGILSDSERSHLNEFCLVKTLNLLKSIRSIDRILVISRDENALLIAKMNEAEVLYETGKGGLNKALYQATNMLDKAVDRAIIIPTDLPLMTEQDIEEILALGKNPAVVVVVPDRRKNGTNVLLVNPAGCIRYRYGEKSSQKHMEEAQKRGIKVIQKYQENLSVDLDELNDLDHLKSRGYIIPILANKTIKETIS